MPWLLMPRMLRGLRLAMMITGRSCTGGPHQHWLTPRDRVQLAPGLLHMRAGQAAGRPILRDPFCLGARCRRVLRLPAHASSATVTAGLTNSKLCFGCTPSASTPPPTPCPTAGRPPPHPNPHPSTPFAFHLHGLQRHVLDQPADNGAGALGLADVDLRPAAWQAAGGLMAGGGPGTPRRMPPRPALPPLVRATPAVPGAAGPGQPSSRPPLPVCLRCLCRRARQAGLGLPCRQCRPHLLHVQRVGVRVLLARHDAPHADVHLGDIGDGSGGGSCNATAGREDGGTAAVALEALLFTASRVLVLGSMRGARGRREGRTGVDPKAYRGCLLRGNGRLTRAESHGSWMDVKWMKYRMVTRAACLEALQSAQQKVGGKASPAASVSAAARTTRVAAARRCWAGCCRTPTGAHMAFRPRIAGNGAAAATAERATRVAVWADIL